MASRIRGTQATAVPHVSGRWDAEPRGGRRQRDHTEGQEAAVGARQGGHVVPASCWRPGQSTPRPSLRSTPWSPGHPFTPAQRSVPCGASSPPSRSALAQATGDRCCLDVCGVSAVTVCLRLGDPSRRGCRVCQARNGLRLPLVKGLPSLPGPTRPSCPLYVRMGYLFLHFTGQRPVLASWVFHSLSK